MNENDRRVSGSTGGGKLVLVALGLAIVAVVLTNVYIERVRRQVSQNTFEVYVLARSVAPGVEFINKDVRKIRLPEQFKSAFDQMGYMDEGGVTTRAGRNSFQRSAAEGEILTYGMFIPPSGTDIDRLIPDGQRMISLPVNSRTAPGALQEGMYVDLEALFRTSSPLPEPITVMERVKVIALGTRTIYDTEEGTRRRFSRNFQTITILVTPEDATTLTAVRQLAVGEFELHLRNPDDTRHPKIPEGGVNPRLLRLIEQGGPAGMSK